NPRPIGRKDREPGSPPLTGTTKLLQRSGTGSAILRPRYGVERLPACTLSLTPPTFSLRKEVIQPQVLLRLPCYDFTPIMNHTLGRCSPCGSACGLLVQST